MKAISLHDPFGSLIAMGIKTLETRSRAIHYRGEIAIHVAKRWTHVESDAWTRFARIYPDRFPALAAGALPPLGCVVALAEVTACIRFAGDELLHGSITQDDVLTGDTSPGRYGWRIEGVRALRVPLPLVGRQSLWTLTEAQAAEVLERAAGRGTFLHVPKLRQIVEHSLGLDNPGKRRPYRDYFCASLDSPDARLCEALVARGLMRSGHAINDGRDRYFHVTEAGAVAVGHVLPKDRS